MPWSRLAGIASVVLLFTSGAAQFEVIDKSSCEGQQVKYQACDKKQCNTCVPQDCSWAPWRDWSACMCEHRLKERQRGVAVSNNECGSPCNGKLSETARCEPTGCTNLIDCELSDWAQWGACSCTCGGGQRSRHRQVKTSPANGGKLCPSYDKTEVAQCKMQPCGGCVPVNGQWGDWSPFGPCSANCGGGLQWHSRNIAASANECGKAVTGEDKRVQVCATASCHKDVDCTFRDWTVWTACSCTCDGTMQRSREIATYGSGNGKFCMGHTKEAAPCHLSSSTAGCHVVATPPRNCQLSQWAPWGECYGDCDKGHHERNRQISVEAKDGGLPCSGILSETAICPLPSCALPTKTTVVNCVMGDWADWGSCDKCGGQKKRFRHIETMPQHGGAPCQHDALESIVSCPRHCHDKTYCQWSGWDAGVCSAPCGSGSMKRTRHLIESKAPPAVGDAWELEERDSCQGEQTSYTNCNMKPCADACIPVDCKVGDWASWSDCQCTGLRERHRSVVTANNECGHPCTVSLVDAVFDKACGDCSKPRDCEWDVWAEWGACTCSCGGGQKSRNRGIKVTPHGNGKPCEVLDKVEVAPCNTQMCGSVACTNGAWGDWSGWGQCSASCVGGVQWRSRNIIASANECGFPVTGNDKEFKECNKNPCEAKVDLPCQWGDWAGWSACSCKCDGVSQRSREILSYGTGNGAWCLGPSTSLKPCHIAGYDKDCPKVEPPVACKLSEWRDWSACDGICGRGQRKRSRGVDVEPKNGGAACDDRLAETEPCSLSPCTQKVGVPCKWSLWSDWGACDKCGGQRKRFRDIEQMPKDGGIPCVAQGSDDVGKCPRHCHKPVTCEWTEWASAGTCSSFCESGHQKFVRYLEPGLPAAAVPVSPVPAAPVKPALDTHLGGAGTDYYNIVNIANERAMYALETGLQGTDGTDNNGLGASTNWDGTVEQNWRIQKIGMQDGKATFKITNDASQRRLYAKSGTEGLGMTGFGATNGADLGQAELWFVTENVGDSTQIGFTISNALSQRFLFADSGVNDGLGVGAIVNSAGRNIVWKLRAQSRQIADGMIIELYHSEQGGTDASDHYCPVTKDGTSVFCNGVGMAGDSAKFLLNVVDERGPIFTLKSIATNRYCSPAGVDAILQCNDLTAGPPQHFEETKPATSAGSKGIALKSATGYCLGGGAGASLHCSSSSVPTSGTIFTSGELFEIRCVDDCVKVRTIATFSDEGSAFGGSSSTSRVPLCLGVGFLFALATYGYRRYKKEYSAVAGAEGREVGGLLQEVE